MNNSVLKFHLGTGTSHDSAQDWPTRWVPSVEERGHGRALVALGISSSGDPEHLPPSEDWEYQDPSRVTCEGNSLWATKSHQHQAQVHQQPQVNQVRPRETQNDSLWTPVLFWSQIPSEYGDPSGKLMIYQAGAGEEQQICYCIVRLCCAFMLEPSQQPTCHAALKNWG